MLAIYLQTHSCAMLLQVLCILICFFASCGEVTFLVAKTQKHLKSKFMLMHAMDRQTNLKHLTKAEVL